MFFIKMKIKEKKLPNSNIKSRPVKTALRYPFPFISRVIMLVEAYGKDNVVIGTGTLSVVDTY